MCEHTHLIVLLCYSDDTQEADHNLHPNVK